MVKKNTKNKHNNRSCWWVGMVAIRRLYITFYFVCIFVCSF